MFSLKIKIFLLVALITGFACWGVVYGIQFIGPSTCPSGTYDAAWNGDHSSGNLYACFNSGASSSEQSSTGTPTISGSYGESGNGILLDGHDKSVDISQNASATGTIWVRVKETDASRSDDVVVVAGIGNSTSNVVYIRLRAAGTVRGVYIGDGSSVDKTTTGTVGFSQSDFEWVGVTWENDGSDRFSVYVNGAWEDATSPSLPDFSVTPDELFIGENHTTLSHSETISADNIYYIDGSFKASAPAL